MSNGIPYLRQVEVKIGPIEEWRGGGNGKLALSLYGDGGVDSFRIQFDVQKHAMTTASPTVIQVYNLSQGLRDALCKENIQVALFVGWQNTEMVLLYTGSLLAVVNRRQGPDIVTELYSNPAYGGMSRAQVELTFTSGVAIKEIVFVLSSQIQGVTVDDKNIQIDENKSTGSQGYSCKGTVAEALTDLARTFGFNWHVDNKIFYAVDDNRYLASGSIPLISSRTGNLVKVDPMLASPQQLVTGVSIQSLLNPYVEPDKLVRLESDLNPKLNGEYKVHMLSHNGDTHGMAWDTHITSWVIMNT